MSFSHLFKSQLPYAINLFEGDQVQFVNRGYLPLGITDKQHPKELIEHTKLTVTPEIIESLRELAVPPLSDDRIFLYDDKSSPEDSYEMTTRYLEKFRKLISIGLTPLPMF